MQTFVEREMSRTNRNLLVTTLVLGAVLVGGGVLTFDYYRDFFGGPYPASVAELAQARRAHSFVMLHEGIVRTGYEKTEDGKSTASYLAAGDGEHFVLMKAPLGTQSGGEISGWVGDLESVDQDVLSAIRKEEPEAAARFLPVVVDATHLRTNGIIGLIAGALLFALFGRNLLVWSSRQARPDVHPIRRRLAQLGEARSLASQLDMELRGGPQTFKGGASVTASWLVVKQIYGLGLVPLERLAWIFKKVIRRKHAFITVSKTFEAVIHDRDGAQLSVRAKEAEIDRLLGTLAERAPWAIAGYDAQMEKAWNKSRAEVVAAVDARRQQQQKTRPG